MQLDTVLRKLEVFKNPNFIFNEAEHSYKLNKKPLDSVTGWINKFIPKYDADFWANKKAIEYGVSKEEVLHGWKIKTDNSLDLGHNVHKYIEDFLSGLNPIMPEDEMTKKRINAWLLFYEEKLKKMTLLDQELRIWSERFGLAGTIDALFWWKNNLIVGDWKTNGKFKTDEDRHYENLLYPFEEYPNNTLNKYSLQLSTYQAILKDHGFVTNHAFICWISPNAEIKMFPAKNFSNKIYNYLVDTI